MPTTDTPTDKTKTPKRGRPKGSKNSPHKSVTQRAARCPYCDSTEHAVLRRLMRTDYCGVTADGQRYTSITRRRVRCKSCNRIFMTVRRSFDPRKWR